MKPVREPTLIDLLNDPVIHLVMKADGVSRHDVLDLYATESTCVKVGPAFICGRGLESFRRPEIVDGSG